MKRTLAALMLVLFTAIAGCVEDSKVVKGGGESAVLELDDNRTTGRIDVRGHVVNTGGRDAKDVVLYFKFFQAGAPYLEEKLLLGNISAGSSESFSGTFYGTPATAATFTWEYRIDWD